MQSKIIDQNKKALESLQQLGLSEKEALVYFALLSRKDVGSSKLVLATGLHKQFVYNALARLEELGLVKHILQNGRKKFSASAPGRILSLAEEKKLIAQNLVRQLQDQYVQTVEQSFEVYQGADALVSHELEMFRTAPIGTRIDVINALRGHYFSLIGEENEEYERIRAERKISVRYIGPESGRDEFKKMEKNRVLWEYRAFPGLSTGLVDMAIWPESIVFNIFGKPLLCFTLTNKEIADGYREFFEALWKVSSK